MRQKKRKTVVTFSTTTDALAFESWAANSGIPGRIIPVPTDISAGCGLAWCIEASERSGLIAAMAASKMGHEGIFEVELY